MHELAFRGRQELSKRRDVVRYRLGMDRPPSLHPAVDGAAPRFFFDAAQRERVIEVLRTSRPADTERILARAERVCAHEFDLLGFRGLTFEGEIDWQLDVVHGRRAPLLPWYRIPFLDFDAVGDHKIIWELNRHQHLVLLAKAFLLSDDPRFVDELVVQWRHWRDHNPYPLGINWASALEAAFRSLSWIWVDQLLRHRPEVDGAFLPDLRRELGRHGDHLSRYLSTYFAPNTHLLGEAVALFFIGTLYPDLRRAAGWRDTGWRITLQEAHNQVRQDGMHFEQAIYYHVYALDFFLHALLLARRNEVDVPAAFEATIQRMVGALVSLAPGGVAPRTGDDDGGRLFDPSRNRPEHMLDPVAAAAVVFERPDWQAVAGRPGEEALWLLGPDRCELASPAPERPIAGRSDALPAAGLYVLAGRGAPGWRMVVDAGPQGVGRCGHGHADALSAQLASPGGDWLIDVGTASYMRADQRDRFRGTAAHNTLTAGGLDQAVPTEPFAWQRIPSVAVERWMTTAQLDYLRASHDGYERHPTPVTHRRTLVAAEGFWLVRDEAVGAGESELALAWHLAPGASVIDARARRLRLQRDGESLTMAFAGPEAWSDDIEDTEWSPAYGITEPTRVVRLRCRSRLPVEVASLILAHDWEGRFEARSLGNGIVYEIEDERRMVHVVFAHGPWRIGDFAGTQAFALLAGPSLEDLELIDTIEGDEVP
jgi:hypothetical protein